ncbi:MAG: transketolase [Candidatus Heimdallarchaeota archaeon]
MRLSEEDEKKVLIDILSIKKDILKMIFQAQSGHPGGSLSCATIIYLLYNNIMKINREDPSWSERDIFILSKGHAAPALYAVLSKIGFINRKDLFTLRQIGSELQGHPIKNSKIGIEISSGSLGMGLSIGVGCALAAKLDNNERLVYVLLGDGELNEGSIWEAILAACHYKLDNLIAIVDRNGIQNDGSTEEIMALEPLAEKWRAFGWEVIETDGSDLNEILQGFEKCKNILGKPKVIISYLIKGADISFMQHTQKYHGRAPNEEEYALALKELDILELRLKKGDL